MADKLRIPPSEVDRLEFYFIEYLLEHLQDKLKEEDKQYKKQEKESQQQQQMSAPDVKMPSMGDFKMPNINMPSL